MSLFKKWAVLGPILLLNLALVSRAVDPSDFLESLKPDEDPSQKSSTEYPNGVNVIPGEPGIHYPIYDSVQKSKFSCIGRPVGFYADTELRCQVWHICDEDRRQQSFLCTNGTVYSQTKRVCDWWYNVNCDPEEVSQKYEQNHDLYKGPPPKSGDKDQPKTTQAPTTAQPKSSPSSSSSFYNSGKSNNPFQYFQQPQTTRRPPPPPPPPTTRRTTTTTTYRPPPTTTRSTPPPPAALQGFPSHSRSSAAAPRQQSSFPFPPPPRPSNSSERAKPSLKTFKENGKRIVELRVPISQVPPEILAKYGKRIPEHILKEIFNNFTRNQQLEIQEEAIEKARQGTFSVAGINNKSSPPPKAPIPSQNAPAPTYESRKPSNFGPPPTTTQRPFSYSNAVPKTKSNNNTPPPPPPPPPPSHDSQQKFRHSTPRKVEGVRFATPTRELLSSYDDDREQTGESQNPAYAFQQLLSGQSRFSGSKSSPAKEAPQAAAAPSSPPNKIPRRRTQSPTPFPTTTKEPEVITDRYIFVGTPEEKKLVEQERIYLIAKQGGKVVTPFRVAAGQPEPYPPQLTPRRFPNDLKKIPKANKESFQESESRYPFIPTSPPPTSAPLQLKYDFVKSRPTKPRSTTTPRTTPPPQAQSTTPDYDGDDDDGSPKERFNKEELELLRLAQEYVDLTGQNFGVKQPKSA